MYYLGTIIACIIGYLIGAISFSVIIVRWRYGVDVRTTGSGNAGATNTARLLGKKWGIAVVFLDGIKVVVVGFVAVGLSFINSSLFSQTSYFIPCIFALIGHCYPVYYNFKGGKAVSCFLGLLLVVNYAYLLLFLFIWWTTIFIFKKVSVSSIIAALTIGVIIWIPHTYGVNSYLINWNSWTEFNLAWSNGYILTEFNWMHTLTPHEYASSILEMQMCILIGFLILGWRHFPNIKRIKNKTEPITFPKLTNEEKHKLKIERELIRKQKKETKAKKN
ncbi:acyl-phosphate glycerol 3-phosphate acyltransferase [Mesoplasma syrphidae]|uniref:Glycerol-3-phosphate acyltransferase n=1 Tax=Mesoplasma syrphidae TaxID=225999 RepID=A0A2K9BYX9_9MOLU|nr:glycerol-3-phosphate 1-O-acyltransferase PlsY [Mesoplasma syrphidae]AUF83578.1 acyl-phosphate glycerol 3-phosphate acyltransferase [Mesoplasma syrphidae]